MLRCRCALFSRGVAESSRGCTTLQLFQARANPMDTPSPRPRRECSRRCHFRHMHTPSAPTTFYFLISVVASVRQPQKRRQNIVTYVRVRVGCAWVGQRHSHKRASVWVLKLCVQNTPLFKCKHCKYIKFSLTLLGSLSHSSILSIFFLFPTTCSRALF